MPSQQFIDSVAANLAYWRTRMSQVADGISPLPESEWQNLYRAVTFGLALPETWPETAELARRAFSHIQQRGIWRDWLPILTRLAAAGPPAQTRLKRQLLNQLGQLHRRDWNMPAAIQQHQAALALAETERDAWDVAEAHFNLSTDYAHTRAYDAAQAHGLLALEFYAASAPGSKWLAATLNTLGIIAQGRGDAGDARQRLQPAVRLWRALRQPEELARSLINLGMAEQALGAAAAAVDAYQEAAVLLADGDYGLDPLIVQINLGALYFELGQLAEAEAAFRAADVPFLRQSQHAYYRAVVLQGLGNVFLKQAAYAAAESTLQECLALCRALGDGYLLGNALGTLGDLAAAQGRDDDAIQAYDDAMAQLQAYAQDARAEKLLAEIAAARRALNGRPGLGSAGETARA